MYNIYIYIYLGIFHQAICCLHIPQSFCRSFKQMKKSFLSVSFYPGLRGKRDSTPAS